MIKLILSIVLIMFSFQTIACVHGDGEGFMPENDMNIPVHKFGTMGVGGIGEVDFNDVIDRIEHVYAPIIQSYGGTLRVARLWDNGKVNAMASRQPGGIYQIDMFGGMARHQYITKDGFALVACHEVGHHIGGVPRYSGNPQLSWASTEGQSDYFAVTKCLRKLFRNDNNVDIVDGMSIPSDVKTKCETQFSVANDAAICMRIAMAGKSTSEVLGNSQATDFNTPDRTVVNTTIESHPNAQCRLDTYYSGAKCEVQDTVEIGQNDANVGTCNRKDKHTEGMRSLCWFKPNFIDDGSGDDDDDDDDDDNNDPPTSGAAKTPTVNGQTSVTVSNPNTTIPVFTDVSGHAGVANVAIEFSKVNKQFLNPNSTAPDRVNGMRVEIYPNLTGTYKLIPMRHLPQGWGTYQIRVIGLDVNKKPVSKNSNALSVTIRR